MKKIRQSKNCYDSDEDVDDYDIDVDKNVGIEITLRGKPSEEKEENYDDVQKIAKSEVGEHEGRKNSPDQTHLDDSESEKSVSADNKEEVLQYLKFKFKIVCRFLFFLFYILMLILTLSVLQGRNLKLWGCGIKIRIK